MIFLAKIPCNYRVYWSICREYVLCRTIYGLFVLFPKSNAVNFYIRAEAPAGTPLEKTSKLMKPIENALMEIPKNELQAFTTRVGVTGDAYFLTEQENQGFILVDLVPFSGRKRLR